MLDSLEEQIKPAVKYICVSQFCGKLLPDNQVKMLLNIKNKYKLTIIEDTTHSLLSSPLSFGDYGVCALYKWFPSPCGGVLYSRNHLNSNLQNLLQERHEPERVWAMIMYSLKTKGLISSTKEADEIFNSFDKELTEKYENSQYLSKLPDFDRFILSCFSVYEITEKRKSNVKTLIENLNFDLIEPVYKNISPKDCMFVYPIYTKYRDSLKKYLAEQKIYTAVYWDINKIPYLNNNINSVNRSSRILALPVNHDYNCEDMIRMAEAVNKWQKIQKGI